MGFSAMWDCDVFRRGYKLVSESDTKKVFVPAYWYFSERSRKLYPKIDMASLVSSCASLYSNWHTSLCKSPVAAPTKSPSIANRGSIGPNKISVMKPGCADDPVDSTGIPATAKRPIYIEGVIFGFENENTSIFLKEWGHRTHGQSHHASHLFKLPSLTQ